MVYKVETKLPYRIRTAPEATPYRGGTGQLPPEDFKKATIRKYEVFSCNKVIKISFLSSLTRKYLLCKGFYHYFSTKQPEASGSLTPPSSLCPGAAPEQPIGNTQICHFYLLS